MSFYKWDPARVGIDLNNDFDWNDVTAEHLRQGLMTKNVKPPTVDESLQGQIGNINFLPPNNHDSYEKKFPFDDTLLLGLKVARDELNKRKWKMTIDFVVGGSFLDALTSTKNNHTHVGYRVPGTETIMISKMKNYSVYPHKKGLQFERMLTGGNVFNKNSYSHMQLVTINSCNVLFVAETDGVDSQGYPMEIKLGVSSGWNQSFQLRTILQMISNGSNKLVYGVTDENGLSLNSVTHKTLDELIKDNITDEQKNDMVQKIIQGLTKLHWMIESDNVYDVKLNDPTSHTTSKISVDLNENLQILPPPSVVLSFLYNVSPKLLAQDAFRINCFKTFENKTASGVTTTCHWTNVYSIKEFFNGILGKENNTEFQK